MSWSGNSREPQSRRIYDAAQSCIRRQAERRPHLPYVGIQRVDGEMSKALLDDISTTQPICVMQRSLHEVYLNTPMMEWLTGKGFDRGAVAGNPQVDLDAAHFWEDGSFSVVLPYLAEYILDPVRVDKGYQRARDYLTFNGVTTCADMSTGSANWDFDIVD